MPWSKYPYWYPLFFFSPAECRAFQENPQNDGPDGSEDDDSESPVAESEGGKDNNVVPFIFTTGLSLEVKEGSDVNLPCKVPKQFGEY